MLALGVALAPDGTEVLLAQSSESDYAVSTSGILVEAAAGWDGTVDQSRPVPVSFLFSNASQQNVDAGLYLSDPVRRHEIKIGDVFLGAGGTRQLSAVVNLEDWYECVASLRDERGVVWSRLLPTATGKEFDNSANFLLFISDSGRSLTLPTDEPAEGTAKAAMQREDVRCLTVNSWQVPRHYGPLVAAQAMVFPDASTIAGELNRVQWQAITDWVCQGGRLFVHADSAEILERLSEASAIPPGLPETNGVFEARPMGLGKLLLYDQPLFAGGASAVRKRIGDVTAQLNRDHISFLVNPGDIRVESSGHAELNRVIVVIFFLGYTLASGVVTLLLFRSTRRRVVIYITSVVGVSTVLAASLGAFLRVSDGDLRWITATQVGAGGTVQVARIEVQSSGGRSKTVSVTGDRPDLQYLGPRDNSNFYYYYWERRQSGFPPFTWQPSQATNDDRAYQVNAPVTPWGFSRLHASATGSWGDSADIKLDFRPTPRSNEPQQVRADGSGFPTGTFSLTISNHAPVQLSNCWLVVGTSHRAVDEEEARAAGRMIGRRPAFERFTADAITAAYQMEGIGDIPANGSISRELETQLRCYENEWQLELALEGGSVVAPRIAYPGATSAWLIGQLDESPLLSIDSTRSNFILRDEVHIYIQEIRPEDFSGTEFLSMTGR